MEKHKRILTIVESREVNQKGAHEIMDKASEMGWSARLVKQVSKVEVAENNLDHIFSDFVWWRGMDKNTNNEVVRMLYWINKQDKITLNTQLGAGRVQSSNKFVQHGMMMTNNELKSHVLPMYEATDHRTVLSLIEAGKITFPFVLKPAYGTRGEGIHLIKNNDELTEFARGNSEDDRGLKNNFTDMEIEPYIDSDYDWRVFVIGGKAVGVMRKDAVNGKRQNFERRSGGVRGHKFKEEDPEVLKVVEKIAVLASEASGFDYNGVDVIRDKQTGEYYVLESNSSAGWQNAFEEITDINIPEKVIKYFEKEAERRGWELV